MIVRDFKAHDITENDLRILLSFVEEDVHDYQRHSTAFPLLKVGVAWVWFGQEVKGVNGIIK